MIINHNMNALNAHRNMVSNTANSGKSMEKLSSGLRINRAGDDAAGLAISEKMRGQIRGLDQASRNAQDGISLIQTAEGALNETHSILQRMRELSVQAGNDTNTESDRDEIQKEINQLTSEINRIGNTTEFNEQKLLNGTGGVIGDVETTIEATSTKITGNTFSSVNGELKLKVDGGEEKTITFDGSEKDIDAVIEKINKEVESDIASKDEDGRLVLTSTTKGATSSIEITDGSVAKELGLLSEVKGEAGEVTEEAKAAKVIGNTFTPVNGNLKLKVDDGDEKTITFDGSETSIDDIIDKINAGAGATIASKNEEGRLVLTSITKGERSSIEITGGTVVNALGVSIGKETGENEIKKEGTAAKITGNTFSSVNGDLKLKVDGGEEKTITFDGSEKDIDAVIEKINKEVESDIASKDEDGRLVLTSTTKGEASSIEITGGTVANALGVSSKVIGENAKSVKTGVVSSFKLQIGANENQTLTIDIGDMRAAALGLTGNGEGFCTDANVTNGTDNTDIENALDVSTSENAGNATTVIQKAIDSVSAERSKLGAYQNRLEHTVNNLGTSSENLTAAESRVRDVDMAKEMMTFSKNNILAQAAQSMLAQANQQPQQVLSLLR